MKICRGCSEVIPDGVCCIVLDGITDDDVIKIILCPDCSTSVLGQFLEMYPKLSEKLSDLVEKAETLRREQGKTFYKELE